MLLKHLNIIDGNELQHIRINNGKIEKITSTEQGLEPNNGELTIEFADAIAFPGLINSHDHLEFNLFPRLGNRIYKNYLEWGEDIHRENGEIIHVVSKIPKPLRVEWGIYKNLFNGFTTVVQHGEYFPLQNPLIYIYQQSYSLHSVHLERKWKLKLNKPFVGDRPFVIHVGEGTDKVAFEEINELIKWNLLKRRLVAVHGVAMIPEQAKAFEALIWCPDSNFFLLDATANVSRLKNQTKILFGTDSTVSASWNAWEQIRMARMTNMLTDDELFSTLTTVPVAVWGLYDRGTLAEGKNADIVVTKAKDKNYSLSSFFQTDANDILLLLRNGEIILFDETLYSQLDRSIIIDMFSKVIVNDACKYVKGNLGELMNQIKKFSGEIKLPIEIEGY